ncbi:E3 ubiquitin-protein ligase RNF187 [Sus scrofa]|uniref:E3 ubiquitin-protein ligase RNF187 n=1 Tax=Sus scrofa TaxID=9823 RepID=UPI000A2B886F|nr:E3 ubiquitin-protein ligase RNF187 [Sus scrofa]
MFETERKMDAWWNAAPCAREADIISRPPDAAPLYVNTDVLLQLQSTNALLRYSCVLKAWLLRTPSSRPTWRGSAIPPFLGLMGKQPPQGPSPGRMWDLRAGWPSQDGFPCRIHAGPMQAGQAYAVGCLQNDFTPVGGLEGAHVFSSHTPTRSLLEGPITAALALPGGPAEAACALCQRAPREPVRADCGHRFCRACVVRFWAEEDGPFPCPECADDCWQRAVEPGRPPLSRRLLALEEAAAAPARDGPASEAALQLLCRADGGPLCAACRMAAGPEPPEWEPRWRKALRGKENKGSVEIMKKDLNDARDLHGQAESAAAVWKGHVMDRRKKALTDYKKLRAFFAEEEGRFLKEAEKEEGSPEDEDEDPAERFRSLLQAVSELERRHRNLGLSMLLQPKLTDTRAYGKM